MNAQAARAGTGTARPRASRGSAAITPIRLESRSGRLKVSRYIATLMASRPTARTLSTIPQAASLPCCLVSSGPRICHGPTFTMFRTKYDTDIAISQPMARYSRHPSPMSAISPRRGAPARDGRPDSRSAGSRAKNAAATRKLSASRAMAHPPPMLTTSSPPAVGPKTRAAFCEEASSELARWMLPASTSSGSTPASAGDENAVIAPPTADRPATAARL